MRPLNRQEQPGPENGYRLYNGDSVTADLFNGIFTSLHNRLLTAEGKSADYDAAVDRIINQALQTVSASLTVEIEAGRAAFAAGRAEFEAVRAAFDELQAGGFSATRISANLDGAPAVRTVQAALATLRALLPIVGEGDGSKFLRAKADRSGFELAEVDLYSAALVQRVARSANVQIVKADKGKLFVLTGTFTQAVVSPATLGAGHHYLVKNAGTGNITIPASDGRTNWIMYPGELRLFHCDGTTLRSEVLTPFSEVAIIASATFVVPPGYRRLAGIAWNGGWGGSGSNGTAGRSGGPGGSSWLFEVEVGEGVSSLDVTIGAGANGAPAGTINAQIGGVTSIAARYFAIEPSGAAGNGSSGSLTAGGSTNNSGGGGGGGDGGTQGGTPGGISRSGGNGGRGGNNGEAGQNGLAPGGGGGGAGGGGLPGGNGARGEVRIRGVA